MHAWHGRLFRHFFFRRTPLTFSPAITSSPSFLLKTPVPRLLVFCAFFCAIHAADDGFDCDGGDDELEAVLRHDVVALAGLPELPICAFLV